MNRTGSTGGDGSVSTSTGSVSPPRRSSGQRAGRRARCHRRTSSVGSATEGSPTGDGGCVGGTSTQVRPLATSCFVPRPSSGHVSPTSGSTGHFESPPARAEVKSLLRNGADIGSALPHQEGSTRPRRSQPVLGDESVDVLGCPPVATTGRPGRREEPVDGPAADRARVHVDQRSDLRRRQHRPLPAPADG
jgi:hypothetical protein